MKKVLHTEKSLYNEIVIYEKNDERRIRFAGQRRITQSCMSLKDRNILVAHYARMLCSAFYLQPEPSKVLVVGLGGGILPTAFSKLMPLADINVVEIDPVMVHLARKYFDFQTTPKMTIAEEDGGVFIKRAIKEGLKYDLVVLDAFSGNGIPRHLISLGFLCEVKAVMSPCGVLAANICSKKDVFNAVSESCQSIFNEHFFLKRKKWVISEYIDFRRRNRVILAKSDGLPSINDIQTNSRLLEVRLRPFGVEAKELLPLFCL